MRLYPVDLLPQLTSVAINHSVWESVVNPCTRLFPICHDQSEDEIDVRVTAIEYGYSFVVPFYACLS